MPSDFQLRHQAMIRGRCQATSAASSAKITLLLNPDMFRKSRNALMNGLWSATGGGLN
jgi:hypothetical protein